MLNGFSREASRVYYQEVLHSARDPSGLKALTMTPEEGVASSPANL
jgi:hypothetical protein